MVPMGNNAIALRLNFRYYTAVTAGLLKTQGIAMNNLSTDDNKHPQESTCKAN